jgi:hypothetical protein
MKNNIYTGSTYTDEELEKLVKDAIGKIDYALGTKDPKMPLKFQAVIWRKVALKAVARLEALVAGTYR